MESARDRACRPHCRTSERLFQHDAPVLELDRPLFIVLREGDVLAAYWFFLVHIDRFVVYSDCKVIASNPIRVTV